jgi:arylsulfatase
VQRVTPLLKALSVIVAAVALELTAPPAWAADPATSIGAGTTPTTARKPNIVIILGDDMGYADMGKVGSEIKTPNLDSLAKEGVQSRPVGKSG